MNDIFTCKVGDEFFPAEIVNMPGMPRLLYFNGDISILNKYKNVAIIGSRSSSKKGLELSYEAGESAARLGLNVVNGLALGCDTEAIKGALSAGGKCIAIMPCGLDQIQPRSNHLLAEQIVKTGGCIISEYPLKTEVKKYQYVERDRLQSGLSQGVLVVEALENSGTMHTADFASKQYKRLAAYSSVLLQHATGNAFLEAKNNSQIIRNKEDIIKFYTTILQEPKYEQMTLFD